MKQKNSLSRILWPGIILILLAGLLITLSETVTASDEIIITPTSGLTTTEAGVSATFTVVLFSQPTDTVTIGLSSSDTTEGTVSPESLTFTPADWSVAQTVTITGVDDLVDDGDIVYTIITAPAVSSDPVYYLNVAGDVPVTNVDNDTAGFTVSQTAGLTTTEAAGTASFTVVLASQPTADVTIGLTSSNLNEGTVLPPSLTFTQGNWSVAQTVIVTGVDDFIDDGDIVYTIVTTASSADSIYNAINPADVSVTNVDNDTAGITVSPTLGLITTEALGTTTFSVVLTSQPTADVTIGLSSSDTTEGTVAPTSVTFTSTDWSTAQTMIVTGVDDAVVDGNILYTIVTAAAVSTDTKYSGVNPSDVTVTNVDNDVAGITVSPTSGLITTEAAGTASFTVRLTSQPTADVTIGLISSNTGEGTVTPSNLTFTSGTWSALQTVTVTGVDDPVADGNIVYTIVTAAAVSTDTAYNGLNPADVSVTNTDNDTAGITVSPTLGLITTEALGTATFTVVLTSQPAANVTIGLSSSDTTEGTVSPASLVFTSVNWSVAQSVTVTGVDDAVDDGDISYSVVTAAAVSSDAVYNGLNPVDASVINQDNDTAGITVSQTSGLTTTEAAGTATFTVVLTSQPTANVTIGLSSSDTTEGTVSPASLTFTSANWSTAQTVTVTGVDDPVDDGDISYTIVTTVSSSDLVYNALNPADASVINVDNDTAGFTVSQTSGLTTTEAAGTATFTVVLTSQPSANVTVGLSSSDITEGTVTPASLTFTSANWSTAQTVTVTGVDDSIDDGDIIYNIITAAAVSSDSTYSGLDPANVSVTNQDNDTAGITVSQTSGLTTTEALGTATFTVVLTSQPTANVTIGLSSSDTTEGTVSPASLTFTSTNWSTTQTVTVTGVDDPVDDGDISYSVVTAAAVSSDAVYNALNPADVSVTNVDNDTAGITVSPTTGLTTTEAGSTTFFTVVLTSQPTANVTMGLSSSNINEGTVSPASLTFTQANWNTSQTVTVTGVDDFVDDGDVLYTIVTAAAVSTDAKYGGVDPPDVSVTNTDNDTAGFIVNPTAGLTTTEAGGKATFTIRLASQPTGNVTIGLSSSNTNEGTVAPASLIFTPGTWGGDQTVTVTGVDDFIDDGDITYTIVTASAVSSDSKYGGVNPPDVTVTNQDDDTAGFSVNPKSGLNTSEVGSEVTFTIVLTSQPLANVTIGLSSSDISEGAVSPSSLTFIPAGWSTPQTVTVKGVDDLVEDGPVNYQIVTAVTNGDPKYMGLNPDDVSLTNQDNDTAGITVNPTSGLITTEAGGKATFTVVLNTQPTASVTIGLSSSDITEATVSPASLTFTSANWSSVQTVTVTGVNDPEDDGDQPFIIVTGNASSMDAPYSGKIVPDVTGTNINNDFTPVAVNDSYLTNATHASPLKIDPPGILANDTDANQDTLSAQIVTPPLLGTLTLSSNGSFVYTPDDISNNSWSDSFKYRVNDGYLNSLEAKVDIMVDRIDPMVDWKSPVPNGGIYEPTDRFVWLVADVIENDSVRQVRFIRWDAAGKRYVDIGVVYSGPFQWYLDTQTLNYQWNQVFVVVTDGAGNVSELPFIWIFRDLPIQVFMPVISR